MAPAPRAKRYAAGRARALGLPTRGTTNPNRLRRIDTWIAATLGAVLRRAADPLVIDLGYGASPVTTVELSARLRRVRPDVRVLGLEIDAERVAAAQPAADPPRLTFARGLERPSELAERLPKALIHHNVPGQPVHALLRDLDAAWESAAPIGTFGRRQRWQAACDAVSADWPVTPGRSRFGELTVAWDAVAPV